MSLGATGPEGQSHLRDLTEMAPAWTDGLREADEFMREFVSRRWAEDWDSPEDAVYDTLGE